MIRPLLESDDPSGFSCGVHELDAYLKRHALANTAAGAGVTYVLEERCTEIEEGWRRRLGRVRAGSSVDLLLRMLPGTPLVNVKSAASILGRSKPQVNDAVARLEGEGILSQVTVGRRNRGFEAREVIDAFADLERQLASLEGDTLAPPPARPVPARRRREGQ